VLTDCEILRIPETRDISKIRRAYRKLVKEIHPDVAGEEDLFRNHLLFIRINRAYERLAGSRGLRPAPAGRSGSTGPAENAALVRHKDPAYAFYRAAMTQFMKIHPSQWSVESKRILEKPGPPPEEELERLKEKVRNLALLFPRAYYYFSIVAHEYPDSVWAHDSREKMALIEDRTRLYGKIIESFTEHAREIPRVNKMFFRSGK
jgi:hypothetical protein